MSEIKTNKISSLDSSNSDITLDPDGTGAVVIDAPIKLDGNYPTGTQNVAMGDTALDDGSLSGNANTAIGHAAMTANTSGSNNVGVGKNALLANTTGADNVAVGKNNMDANSTGSNNTALGSAALTSNTTASNNTALGYQAMAANTTGTQNVAVGQNAADAITTGSSNVAVGAHALGQNTTASNNTAVGKDALTSNTTGANNTAVGREAGQRVTTGSQNTLIGDNAGENITTTSDNTFVGRSAGSTVTSGSKNTIIGRYNGNQGGLDIRTSSNNIVLSDGDGNAPAAFVGGKWYFNTSTSGAGSIPDVYSSHAGVVSTTNSAGNQSFTAINEATSGTRYFHYFLVGTGPTNVGSITTTGSSTSYNTSSDHRLKEAVVDMTGAITRVKALAPKRFNFIADDSVTVDGFMAHEAQAVVPEAVTGTHNEVDADGNPVYQGIDQAKLVPLLTGALQEAIAKIETLETENSTQATQIADLITRVTALENA